jgi:hypothetical protein
MPSSARHKFFFQEKSLESSQRKVIPLPIGKTKIKTGLLVRNHGGQKKVVRFIMKEE